MPCSVGSNKKAISINDIRFHTALISYDTLTEGMEVSEVLAKLKRFEQLLDRKNAPSASADSLPTASMDEFKATKSLLSQFSTALQGEATKLALVIGSGTSDPAATRSIHKGKSTKPRSIQPL